MTTVGLRVGRYEVGERLGKGSFGVVHIAHDAELGREVAIKFLRPEYMMRLQVVQRFLQEARACAKIGHPGIVTVFECGQIQGVGPRLDGTAYIVMERLYGESLGDRIQQRGRLPAVAAIAIARQLAAALHVAHDAGIIHRDLKPDNVYLVKDAAVVGGERVKILDFGVAKLSDPDPDENPNTHSQMMLGTPRYMSPEQARAAAKVDHRTDIYALGCLLYELVCGKPPFGGDMADVLVAHQTAPITPPREIVPSIPAALDELIVRMLAKEPDARPRSMRAVDDALDEVFVSLAPKKRAKTSPDEENTVPHTPVMDETTLRRTVGTRGGEIDEDKTTRRVAADELKVALDTPMSLDPTLVRRPPGTAEKARPIEVAAPWWRWRYAIGVAAAVLSGLIVYLVLRNPSPKQDSQRGSGSTVVVDAGAVVDMAVILVEPDATIIVPDADPTDQLALECKQAQFDKQWVALESCGLELQKTKPAEGQDFVDKASRESRSEVALRKVETALKTKDFKAAATALAAIPDSSVYRNAAATAFEAAKSPLLDTLVADLNTLSAARECAKHAAKLRAIEATHGVTIADEARLVARPCARSGVVTPAPAPTPVPNSTVPTPLDACDKATVEAEEARGDSALTNGAMAQALATYERVLKCKPAVIRKTYLAACRSKNAAKAKRYFTLAGATDSLAQICLKENIEVRK